MILTCCCLVCDKPMAVVDASTTSADEIKTIKVNIPTARMTGKTSQPFMFGIMQWNPFHKWYYYPYQKPNEMMLFHHYNRDKTHIWGNAHSSLMVPGCSDEYETRGSTELRIAVFFPRERTTNAQQVHVDNV